MSPRQILCTVVFVLFINIMSASFCDEVKQHYSPTERYVSQHGIPKNITVYWDNDPARAAAAQLSVVLRYALGYQHVSLRQTPEYTMPERSCNAHGILEGVRIIMTGATAHHRLHLRLANHVRDKAMCLNITKLSSYSDDALLSSCGFSNRTTSGRHVVHFVQRNLKNKTILEAVTAYLKAYSLPFVYNEITHRDLFTLLKTSNKSFFFVDYDMWAGAPDVSAAELRKQGLYANIITTVGDRCLLEQFAPQIFEIADKYEPFHNFIRSILEIESGTKDIEEAVCIWSISKNFTALNTLITKYKPRKKSYIILSIICNEDPDIDEYDELLFFLGMNRYKTSDAKFYIITKNMDFSCSDPDSLIKDLREYMLKNVTSNFIGIIVGSLPNITDIAKILNVYNIPILFYGAKAIDTSAIETSIKKDSTSPMWISTGGLLHLTLALHHFILKMGWDRVTVVSEQSRNAKLFLDDLNHRGNLELRNRHVPQNLTEMEAEKILQDVKVKGARVILVNTDYTDAVTILTAAVKLKMNVANKYTWILREWQKGTKVLNIKLFVISFWCKRGIDIHSTGTGRLDYLKKVDKLWPRHIWPPQAATFINAVLTIVEGFDDVIFKYPQAQDDIQSIQVIKQFERSLVEVPVKGITQTLTYKRHMLEEAVVYVEQWHGYQRKFLVQMRVNSTSHKVITDYVRDRVFFGQYQKDDGALKSTARDADHNASSQSKISYVLGVVVIVVLVLPLFAILLLLKYIRTRKDTV